MVSGSSFDVAIYENYNVNMFCILPINDEIESISESSFR